MIGQPIQFRKRQICQDKTVVRSNQNIVRMDILDQMSILMDGKQGITQIQRHIQRFQLCDVVQGKVLVQRGQIIGKDIDLKAGLFWQLFDLISNLRLNAVKLTQGLDGLQLPAKLQDLVGVITHGLRTIGNCAGVNQRIQLVLILRNRKDPKQKDRSVLRIAQEMHTF